MMAAVAIVLAGAPAWQSTLREHLPETYHLIQYTDPAGYVPRLADDRAALILVDGEAANWRFWTTTPKISAATRRIPVIVVAGTQDVRRAALDAGADVALSPAELIGQLPQLLAGHARVLDPATAEQLGCECEAVLPPLALEAVEHFNAGEYYRQHDLFEALWVQTVGPVRDLYRAILQVGIAYYQIERGNHRGALKMLLRSVQWFAVLPDVCQGVDVRQLREDAYAVRRALEALAPDEISGFDRTLLKPLRLVDQP